MPSVANQVRELMAAEGISRAAAYRRLKPPKPKPPKSNDDPVPADVLVMPSAEGGAVTWAQAILWAAEHIKTNRMTKGTAGSVLNWSLWQFAREEPKVFLTQLVPKALGILESNKGGLKGEQDKAEQLEIADMEDLLAGAIAESQSGS